MFDLRLKVYRTKGVSVNCSFGTNTYVFQEESEEGKKLFFNMAKSTCIKEGVSCRFFKADSSLLGDNLIIEEMGLADVIIFDNADLYLTQRIVDNIRDDQIVFISMKYPFKLNIKNRKLIAIRYDGSSIKFSRREL